MVKDEEILSWIQLIKTDKIGPISFYKLLDEHKDIDVALEVLSAKKEVFSRSNAQKELDKAKNQNIKIIIKKDPCYPKSLLSLPDAPPILYAKGNASLLNHYPSIAIVGSRNASILGRKTAAKIAFDLTNNNVIVISGMARGIDSAAHKGAMFAKDGLAPTIGVLGTGVNNIYPKENEYLYHKIAEQGLLISEFLLDSIPQISNFPRRNRIISGLSVGILVAEATKNSGSLITAQKAKEQNKIVFAIPGSPTESRASGVNWLLKEGGILVENAQDVINVIKRQNQHKENALPTIKNKELLIKSLDNCKKNMNIRKRESKNLSILEHLNSSGTDIDDLIRALGSDSATIAMQILDLEMDNKIIRLAGNKIAINNKK